MKSYLFPYFFAFIVLFTTFSCSEDENDIVSETPSEISITDEILTLVNQHRQSSGLSILEKNETADQLAIDHTRYMISLGDINHDNFNEKSKILREKENASSVAENVAAGQNSAQSVMNSWLNSPGHRQNIEGNYTHIGIGAIKDSQGRYYYTQIFYR